MKDIGHLFRLNRNIEVWAKESTPQGEYRKKIVFSGDIDNVNKPITKDQLW